MLAQLIVLSVVASPGAAWQSGGLDASLVRAEASGAPVLVEVWADRSGPCNCFRNQAGDR